MRGPCSRTVSDTGPVLSLTRPSLPPSPIVPWQAALAVLRLLHAHPPLPAGMPAYTALHHLVLDTCSRLSAWPARSRGLTVPPTVSVSDPRRSLIYLSPFAARRCSMPRRRAARASAHWWWTPTTPPPCCSRAGQVPRGSVWASQSQPSHVMVCACWWLVSVGEGGVAGVGRVGGVRRLHPPGPYWQERWGGDRSRPCHLASGGATRRRPSCHLSNAMMSHACSTCWRARAWTSTTCPPSMRGYGCR